MSRKKKKMTRGNSNSTNTGNPAHFQSLQLAMQLHQREEWNEAKTIYSQVLKEDPENVDANHYMGVLAHQRGRNDIAIGLIQKAIQINPNQPESHCNLGIIYKQLGRINDAIACYRYAIALTPHHAEAHYNLGITLRTQGKLQEAEACYRKALKYQPGNDEIHNNLGMVLQETGRMDEAITCFQKASSINPGNSSARGNLALALKAPDLIQVADTYWKIVRRQPENAEANHKLGQILNELSRHDEAAACFRKALCCAKDQSMMAVIHSDLGKSLIHLGQTKDAISSFQEVLKHRPNSASTLTNIGQAQRELGLDLESEINLRKATTIQPNNPIILFSLAATLKQRGAMPESMQIVEKAIGLIPPKNTKSNGRKNPDSKDENVVALLPLGRSGSLFLHSLIDNHPEISTLPGVYFKGYFGTNTWHILKSRMQISGHQGLVEEFCNQYEPLFDARSKKRVLGDPFGLHTAPGAGSGFDKMGVNRDQWLSLDRETFQDHLLRLLGKTSRIDNKVFFQLIHLAYNRTLNRGEDKKQLFYHIHNPTLFEGAHFLKRFPNARFLVIIREPVQSIESWLKAFCPNEDTVARARNQSTTISNRMILEQYRNVASRAGNFFDMADQTLLFEIRTASGIRLEDVKRKPHVTMPSLARWMGIQDHKALYESSFQGLAYWGPPSLRSPDLKGFDDDNLNRRANDLFSEKDQFIFRTLLYPTRVHFGYQDPDDCTFQKDIKTVWNMLNEDEPLDFEKDIFDMLSKPTHSLQESDPFIELHALLKCQCRKLQENPAFRGNITLL